MKQYLLYLNTSFSQFESATYFFLFFAGGSFESLLEISNEGKNISKTITITATFTTVNTTRKRKRGESVDVIIGIDEVGRGAIAGPLVAAAVLTRGLGLPRGVRDSKELSAGRRSELNGLIRERAFVGIGVASAEEVDNVGIQRCNLLAVGRAVKNLLSGKAAAAFLILVDGRFSREDLESVSLGVPIVSLVKGDKKIPVVSAASICAKVFRDKFMVELHAKNGLYGWNRNAGYGTREHVSAIKDKGRVQGVHRFSFNVRF